MRWKLTVLPILVISVLAVSFAIASNLSDSDNAVHTAKTYAVSLELKPLFKSVCPYASCPHECETDLDCGSLQLCREACGNSYRCLAMCIPSCMAICISGCYGDCENKCCVEWCSECKYKDWNIHSIGSNPSSLG